MFIEKDASRIDLYVCLHVSPAYSLRCSVYLLFLYIIRASRDVGTYEALWLLNPDNPDKIISLSSFIWILLLNKIKLIFRSFVKTVRYKWLKAG